MSKGNYRPTAHAEERNVGLPEVEYVLENGKHVKKYDRWQEDYDDWNYGFCGKTVDGKRIRLAIAFAENLLIVTVIDEDL